MKIFTLTCVHCGQETREHEMNMDEIAVATAAYLAHLVESHWELLEFGRAQRLATGVPVNDAWTRL